MKKVAVIPSEQGGTVVDMATGEALDDTVEATVELDDLEVFGEDEELNAALIADLEQAGEVEVPERPEVPAQLSLDIALFAAYHVPEVLVSVSASDKMSVGELKRLMMGQAIGPGKDVLVTLGGYVGGAGLKWKPDGGGKGAVLSLVGDKVHHITVLDPLEAGLVDSEASGAVARGWAHEKNKDKEMDPDLAAAIAGELTLLLEDLRVEREEAYASRNAWTETAAGYARNVDFYRGLLDQVAVHLGMDAYTDDEGKELEEPVYLKIPELVGALFEPAEEEV